MAVEFHIKSINLSSFSKNHVNATEFSLIRSRTSVEPVKATLSTSMWLAMAAPAVGPNPGTMFTTPDGNPA